LDSREQECDASGKSSETSTAAPSLSDTGRESSGGTTCIHSRAPGRNTPTLSAADLPASGQALLPPFRVSEPEKPSGQRCSGSSVRSSRDSSLSSNRAAMRNGSGRLRLIWRGLATAFPDYNDRLRIIALLIDAGECSSLPTPCKSDGKRWPGSPDHPRLQRSRGLRLQEELGVRPGPEIVEWMMGFPIGWTDLKPSAMPSSLKSPSGSADES
jgi:hypothetical protein